MHSEGKIKYKLHHCIFAPCFHLGNWLVATECPLSAYTPPSSIVNSSIISFFPGELKVVVVGDHDHLPLPSPLLPWTRPRNVPLKLFCLKIRLKFDIFKIFLLFLYCEGSFAGVFGGSIGIPVR